MTREIIEAVRTIEREKGIDGDTLDHRRSRTRSSPRTRRRPARRGTRPSSSTTRATSASTRSRSPPTSRSGSLDEARERALDELERLEVETGEKNHTLLSDDDLDLDWSQVPEEQIKREDVTPENFGRIAAQTAKQVILQRIREAEREMMYEEYVDRVSEVVTGIVQQAGDRNNVLVDLGKVEALLPRSEQVDGERYEQGSRIKAVITEVRSGTKGPQVILSRRDPELIKTLFELEVPEIADGLVEIRGVAREPGYRSKIAVESHAQGVDPVGACVGPRGSRVRMVVSELRGEKIDIIPWNTEPARFVAKALSPARVREVYIDDDSRDATVVVPDDQLALAIGKEGLNARLAARLTGWKVDIVSDTEFAQQEAEAAFGGEGDGGLQRPLRGDPRRTASAARTRRCPARASAACRRTRSCAKIEAQTGEYAPDTVTPTCGRTTPRRPTRTEAADEAAADAPVAAQAEDDARRAAAAEAYRRRAPLLRREQPDPDAAPAAGGRRRSPSSCASRAVSGELTPGRRLPGRGAYTCRRLLCFERALARRGFNRVLGRAFTSIRRSGASTLGRRLMAE